jgi:hypothetical protein
MVKITKAFVDGEIEIGRGLNQVFSLSRAGETRWSSHYGFVKILI